LKGNGKIEPANFERKGNLAMKILAKWSVDEYHHMLEASILRDREEL